MPEKTNRAILYLDLSKNGQMNSKPKSNRRTYPKGLVLDQLTIERSKRRLLRDALRANEQRDLAFRRMILSIPAGKVSTYGSVAAAAGYPRYHRAVARLLRTDPVDDLPWHRVVGAGGEIKTRGAAAHEQRARLRLEGVKFNGKRVDMDKWEHSLKSWEVYQ
jgi:methylated-DNA-protein-cysteine methyltransferase-like protein